MFFFYVDRNIDGAVGEHEDNPLPLISVPHYHTLCTVKLRGNLLIRKIFQNKQTQILLIKPNMSLPYFYMFITTYWMFVFEQIYSIYLLKYNKTFFSQKSKSSFWLCFTLLYFAAVLNFYLVERFAVKMHSH